MRGGPVPGSGSATVRSVRIQRTGVCGGCLSPQPTRVPRQMVIAHNGAELVRRWDPAESGGFPWVVEASASCNGSSFVDVAWMATHHAHPGCEGVPKATASSCAECALLWEVGEAGQSAACTGWEAPGCSQLMIECPDLFLLRSPSGADLGRQWGREE